MKEKKSCNGVSIEFKNESRDFVENGMEVTGKNFISRLILKIFGRFLRLKIHFYPLPPSHPNCRCKLIKDLEEGEGK